MLPARFPTLLATLKQKDRHFVLTIAPHFARVQP